MNNLVIEKLKQQFSNDLLYIYLKRHGFEEDVLFPPFLNSISIEREYSTLEVAELLEIKENNLRYRITKMREIGYIDSFRANRNYRYKYLNIYRMYLVLMILEIKCRNIGDIANLLKENQSETVIKEMVKEPEEPNVIRKDICKFDTSRNELEMKILDKQIVIYELQVNINELYQSYLSLDHRLNLSMLEISIVEKVNEALKQANKKRFFRLNESEYISSEVESTSQLRMLKDEINTLQSDLKEYEKSIAIERHELQKLLYLKRELLVNYGKSLVSGNFSSVSSINVNDAK